MGRGGVRAAKIHSQDKRIQMSQYGYLYAALRFILVLLVAEPFPWNEKI